MIGPARNSDRPRAQFDMSQVSLGPHRLADHTVVLRPPRFDDFSEWRRIRLERVC